MQTFDVGVQTQHEGEQTTAVDVPKASAATLSDEQPAAKKKDIKGSKFILFLCHATIDVLSTVFAELIPMLNDLADSVRAIQAWAIKAAANERR